MFVVVEYLIESELERVKKQMITAKIYETRKEAVHEQARRMLEIAGEDGHMCEKLASELYRNGEYERAASNARHTTFNGYHFVFGAHAKLDANYSFVRDVVVVEAGIQT